MQIFELKRQLVIYFETESIKKRLKMSKKKKPYDDKLSKPAKYEMLEIFKLQIYVKTVSKMSKKN